MRQRGSQGAIFVFCRGNWLRQVLLLLVVVVVVVVVVVAVVSIVLAFHKVSPGFFQYTLHSCYSSRGSQTCL